MKALTAPMGWNSWDCYGAAVTEEIVRKNADFMAKFGIKRATFYCYKSGKFNPDWQFWLELKIAVERYILNESLKLPKLE